MSIPTLQGLQTALSGLIAEQAALDVTGNNIANSDTEGYSRETAVLQTNQPIVIPAINPQTGQGAQLGTGVSVATITRVRNVYLDAQYRTQNSALSEASTQSEELTQAQAAFNEPSSSGLASQISAFWSAWNDLANSPTSEAAKQGVVAAGQELTSTFHEISAQLSTISSQAVEQYDSLTASTGEVADDANQLAQLNGQIKLAEEAGQHPGEMLDHRDLLLDKLSSLAQVTVSEQPDATDTVSFGDAAKPLVEGTTVNWPQTLTESAGGRLGALLGLTSPSGALASYQGALDNVASTLASAVNALHTSTPFFSGTTAATITVAVKAAQVQTSSTTDAGGNNVAQAIAALRGSAAEQDYAALVEQVGVGVQSAQNDQSNLQTTVTAINNQRQSVSGVSLDEEMTNLISFQRGYQASARTLTAMDSMLETLIEHTGTVGL
jgi:flagellar hook-associated protein 1 FlgK